MQYYDEWGNGEDFKVLSQPLTGQTQKNMKQSVRTARIKWRASKSFKPHPQYK